MIDGHIVHHRPRGGDAGHDIRQPAFRLDYLDLQAAVLESVVIAVQAGSGLIAPPLNCDAQAIPFNACHELGRGTIGDNAAIVDNCHPLAQQFRLFDVMGSEDDRPAFLVEPPQVVPQHVAQLHVHPGRGFVHDHQLRLVHQRPGDLETALHAAAQGPDLDITFGAQTEFFQQAFGILPGDLGGHSVIPGLEDHQVPEIEEPVEVELLGSQPDQLPGLAKLADHIVTHDPHRPLGDPHQSGGDPDSGGLTGAVGSQQAEKLPLPNHQVDPFESLDPAGIALIQTFDLYRRGH